MRRLACLNAFAACATIGIAAMGIHCGGSTTNGGSGGAAGTGAGGSAGEGAGGSAGQGAGGSAGMGAGGSAGSGAGGSAGSSSGGTAGAGGAGGAGGSTGGQSVTLTMDTFTVDPGAEVYKCQNYSNPFGGKDADIAEFESHMTKGSHHLLVFYQNVTTGPISDCSGLEFHATPYGAQQPDASVTYPQGVAALIPGTTGIRLQAHYLNTTASPITATVQVIFHIAQPGTVTDHAGVIFDINPNIYVAPHSTGSASSQCAVPHDLKLLMANGHMHQHGTDFLATSNGQTVFHATDWSNTPPTTFNPPMAFTSGQSISWTCQYTNNTDQPLTFGESAQTNEMCIFTGQYYPVPQGQQALIGCQ